MATHTNHTSTTLTTLQQELNTADIHVHMYWASQLEQVQPPMGNMCLAIDLIPVAAIT